MSVTIKNAKVTFSNMRNKMNPQLLSREFCIELPSDSDEIKQLREEFKKIEKKTVEHYTTKNGKKCKNASTEKGLGEYLFSENEYHPGFTRLKFTIYNIREKEVTLENGTTKKQRSEHLSTLYKDLDFCYRTNNNGQREYTIKDKDVHWMPLSENIIDIKASCVGSYNKTDNRATIRLRADEVNIIKASDFGGGSSVDLITLDDDTEIQEKVEKSSTKKSEVFTADELASLDV